MSMIEPNEWIGDPTTGYQPDDPPQGEHWCSECSRWDDECECICCELCDKVTVYSDDLCEDCFKMEQSKQEALAGYAAHKRQQEQEECDHDEHDHGICLSCGKDIFDDLVAAAEFRNDCREDR